MTEVRLQWFIYFVFPYPGKITMALLLVSLEQDNYHQAVLSAEISPLLLRSNRV